MNDNKEHKLKETKEPFKAKKKGKGDLKKNAIHNLKQKKRENDGDNDLGFKPFLKRRGKRTNNKKKKKKWNYSFQNGFRHKTTDETISRTEKAFPQNDVKGLQHMEGGCDNHYENANGMNKGDKVNIFVNSEHNLTKNGKIEFSNIQETEAEVLEKITEESDIDNELKNNIYFNSDEEGGLYNEDKNHCNLQIQQKKIDYVSYIENLSKKNQLEENVKVKTGSVDSNNDSVNSSRSRSSSSSSSENGNKKRKEKEKTHIIVLLFAPLATTSFNSKHYLINADDHLEMFEKKKKNWKNYGLMKKILEKKKN